ncbi:hypothetical protein H6F93_01705 [Leptolyngbya sp. FACHB-671]|uniref:hypothetical protein n=1 Tax=Leptolyngbya sp. FACHB-671 TaxID=2692812 RepID=UPI00168A1F0E|nr:hypothetical protein [Leptolyngbya sp. FACHB-671]MBD2066254.1 hypothetical protein [Leptolyngbya sp. FACHB-671]
MDDLQSGVIGLCGKSDQVFAFYSPNGPAHFVKQSSAYYLVRLRLLRNLIIQFISEGETDTANFINLLEELRCDQDICPALPEEIVLSVSLPQLLLVLQERYKTQENICNWVISAFGKLICELESGRINYYDDSDFEIRPLSDVRKHVDISPATLKAAQGDELIHENIKTLLNRMSAAIDNSDPAGVLHASACVFETLAKDIVGLPSVQNQTLGGFFERYRRDSKLPNELLEYINDIYQQRNRTPLAGHGSLNNPNINIAQAIVLAEITSALVRAEYKLRITQDI